MKIVNHIGIFNNAYSKKFCKEYIEMYYKDVKRHKRNTDSVEDESINLKYYDIPFLEIFWKNCYSKYALEYSMLDKLQSHKIYDTKLQKTKPNQGYHLLHCENTCKADSGRILAFILYLNTVEEGETYFPNQNLKIKPEQGTLAIWPAYFTHPHKGLPPKQNKYIITGWVEFGS